MLSVGARALFMELQGEYFTDFEGYVFLSARDGAKRLRASKENVCAWFKELEHYGFIVKVRDAHLAGMGEGESAHYRLTDRYYHAQTPTRDFEKWDGVIFEPQKRTDKRGAARLKNIGKNSLPVRYPQTPCLIPTDISRESELAENGNKCPTPTDISEPQNRLIPTDISRFTTGSCFLNVPWCVPIPNINPCDEADSPLWVEAWREQIQRTVSLAEIREAMGYRH
jgi:hypothetical protein